MSDSILQRLLCEASRHEVAAVLLSNGYNDKHGRYEIMAGFGAAQVFENPHELVDTDSLLFGFCAYDLKNRFNHLSSVHQPGVSVPDFYFFRPEKWLTIDRKGGQDGNFDPAHTATHPAASLPPLNLRCRTGRDEYIRNVEEIRNCIAAGDFYELNYCLQYEADGQFDPYDLFLRLNSVSPAPFASFFKFHDKFLICSSPERFLRNASGRLISQPIKGTRKRAVDPDADADIRTQLQTSEKERAENIMIVDLVRNDLSRVCRHGTVHVEELCGIYSFSHVHQMISTVTGQLLPGTGFGKILHSSFPMGSMTGAPKVQVMKDIERFENFSRGWYSGSVGWYQSGEFDLNVVIRSLQVDAARQKLFYHVGGAITYDSIPAEEYEECGHKAAGIMAALRS